MTIKQQGGIFGRNPTFNDVEVEGNLTVGGSPISAGGTMASQDADNVDIDGGAIDGITLGTNSEVTYATLNGDANRINIEGGATTYVRLNAWSGSQDADARIVADRNLGSGSQSVLDFQVNNGTSLFTHSRCQTNGNFKIFDGNLVVASGHGIDFSATSGTGTSELFSDYEEGVWTPTVTSTSGTITTVDNVEGFYTKIGREVTVYANATTTDNGTGAGNLRFSGLPFTPVSTNMSGTGFIGVGYNSSSGLLLRGRITGGNLRIDVANYDGTYPTSNGRSNSIQVTYYV
jgi:hypothetical protein